MKFQQDYFGASLACRPVPSVSVRGALDAGDQLHVASGACSPPLAIPELITRLLLQKKKKIKNYLFLPGSIQAASPELNPSLLQSVQYQILQKVEYREKKNVSLRWKLAPQRESWGLFCSQIKLNNGREALPDQAQHDACARASSLGWECAGSVLRGCFHLRGNCQVVIFRSLNPFANSGV